MNRGLVMKIIIVLAVIVVAVIGIRMLRGKPATLPAAES